MRANFLAGRKRDCGRSACRSPFCIYRPYLDFLRMMLDWLVPSAFAAW